MARRFATRESIRRKTPIFSFEGRHADSLFMWCTHHMMLPYIFHNVPAIRANRLKTAIRNFEPPEARFAKKKGGSAREPPKTIRENRAIRANPRIDSRESGHPSLVLFVRFFGFGVLFLAPDMFPDGSSKQAMPCYRRGVRGTTPCLSQPPRTIHSRCYCVVAASLSTGKCSPIKLMYKL